MKYFSKDRFCNFNIHYDVLHSLKYFLECMDLLGVKNVELIGGGQTLFFDAYRIGSLTEVKQMLKEHGLNVQSFSAQSCQYPYQFAVKGEKMQEQTYNFFANGIRVAAELGCHILQINTGWGYWNESKEEGQKRSADMLYRLCEVGKENDVYLAVESLRPQESLIGYKLDDVKKIYDMVGHPYLKAMLDLCAMGVAGESIQEWFDAFGSENVIHTHFQDGNPYYHLIWGEGTRSLDKDLKALYDNNYQGAISQELTLAAYYPDPLEYDRRNLEAFSEFLY